MPPEKVGFAEVADVADAHGCSKSSLTAGSTLTVRPAADAWSAISPMVLALADGTATSRISAPVFAAARAIALRSPMTLTPMIDRRCFDGLSSRSPTAYGDERLRNSAVITCSPPSPAPKIKSFSAVRSVGRRSHSSTSRQT